MYNYDTCENFSLEERLAEIAKMTPGERRKKGLDGFPVYACTSTYDSTKNSPDYTIGRDC